RRTITVLGNVGRLVPPKDQATLVRAFAMAVRSHPDIQLRILGEGPLRSELTSLTNALGLTAKVEFHEPTTDVPSFLAGIDIFGLSSQTEGLPTALLEAMAAARPVIATRVGGVPEILRDQDGGWLVPPSSVDSLAAAITNAVECPDLQERGL